jgi:hypothetical protein
MALSLIVLAVALGAIVTPAIALYAMADLHDGYACSRSPAYP